MGFFEIPTTQRDPNGILALVLAIVTGGIGTIIMGAIILKQRNVWILGIIQAVLTIILVGYVWALVWGIMVFVKSGSSAPAPPAPAAKGRAKKA